MGILNYLWLSFICLGGGGDLLNFYSFVIGQVVLSLWK